MEGLTVLSLLASLFPQLGDPRSRLGGFDVGINYSPSVLLILSNATKHVPNIARH